MQHVQDIQQTQVINKMKVRKYIKASQQHYQFQLEQEKAKLAETIKQKEHIEVLLSYTYKNVEFLNVDLKNILEKYAPIDERNKVIDKVDGLLEFLDEIQEKDDSSDNDKMLKAVALVNKAELILIDANAKPSQTLPLLLKAQQYFKDLSQLDSKNNKFQQAIYISLFKLGLLYEELGQFNKALLVFDIVQKGCQFPHIRSHQAFRTLLV